uniref:Serine-threonine/tyrosine-protein kinase catalytic domain-containing protein n=1 Tax=Oryza rufipogon TaxID=4529 RepID=A0A0E0RCH9_ORYRU
MEIYKYIEISVGSQDGYDLQSVWKIAEVATMCVKPKGVLRPSISEVLKEIQDAIAIELQRELPSSIHHLMSKTSPSEAAYIPVPYDVDGVKTMQFGELNDALADNAGSAILDKSVT